MHDEQLQFPDASEPPADPMRWSAKDDVMAAAAHLPRPGPKRADPWLAAVESARTRTGRKLRPKAIEPTRREYLLRAYEWRCMTCRRHGDVELQLDVSHLLSVWEARVLREIHRNNEVERLVQANEALAIECSTCNGARGSISVSPDDYVYAIMPPRANRDCDAGVVRRILGVLEELDRLRTPQGRRPLSRLTVGAAVPDVLTR